MLVSIAKAIAQKSEETEKTLNHYVCSRREVGLGKGLRHPETRLETPVNPPRGSRLKALSNPLFDPCKVAIQQLESSAIAIRQSVALKKLQGCLDQVSAVRKIGEPIKRLKTLGIPRRLSAPRNTSAMFSLSAMCIRKMLRTQILNGLGPLEIELLGKKHCKRGDKKLLVAFFNTVVTFYRISLNNLMNSRSKHHDRKGGPEKQLASNKHSLSGSQKKPQNKEKEPKEKLMGGGRGKLMAKGPSQSGKNVDNNNNNNKEKGDKSPTKNKQ
jgi:hypothetical protein